jgi:hypothetical protein
MGKPPINLKVRLPRYESPRNEWRKKLHAGIITAIKDKGIKYTSDLKLELHITLYLAELRLGPLTNQKIQRNIATERRIC